VLHAGRHEVLELVLELAAAIALLAKSGFKLLDLAVSGGDLIDQVLALAGVARGSFVGRIALDVDDLELGRSGNARRRGLMGRLLPGRGGQGSVAIVARTQHIRIGHRLISV
jgi:hypothetical protein